MAISDEVDETSGWAGKERGMLSNELNVCRLLVEGW